MRVVMKRPGAIRRDLKYSSLDSFLSSAMVGVGETFLPAFVLAMGASEVHAGLIAALPFLIGSSLQLLVPRVLPLVGSYRIWVAGLCTIQSLAFLPFILAGWFEVKIDLLWIYVAATLYWSCGLAAGPAWNSWMASIVPSNIRMRYFAKRIHIGQVGLLLGLILGGFLLHFARDGGWELKAFSFLFVVASVCRLFSAYFLSRQSEQESLVSEQKRIPINQVLFRLRDSSEGRLIGFLLLFAVAVNLSSPFYNPYWLKQLHLSYFSYMTLIASSFLAKIFVFAAISRVARRADPFQLMKWGIIGSAIIPAFWIFASHPLAMISIQVFSGANWALYELGVTMALFGTIRDEERLSLMSLYNFGSALMVMLGTALGGQILKAFGETATTYYMIFAISAVARTMALFAFAEARSGVQKAKEQEARLTADREEKTSRQRQEPAPVDLGVG